MRARYGVIHAGLIHLNHDCRTSITAQHINEMALGRRNIPACVFNHMFRECLPMVQQEAGMLIPKVGEKDEAPLIMLKMLSLPYRSNKHEQL